VPSRSTRRAPVRRARPRRLDAAAAREGILDAAAKRLVESGPAGIRLQEVAADAGVSHPTVLHHFGSREQLVQAVIARSLDAIHTQLVEAISKSTGEEAQVATMLDGVFDALTANGHGRVILWLALEGHPIDGAESSLDRVVDAAHALRRAHRRGKGRPPPREDTAHLVVLATLALIGSTVMGPQLLAKVGLGTSPDVGPRFRAWLAKLLSRHLEG
jgi:AcrR family transcriptional regulator